MRRGAVLVAAVVTVICGGGAAGWFLGPPSAPAAAGSPTAAAASPRPTGPSSEVPAIRADWTAFFSASTPVARRVQLLQHGQAFSAEIRTLAASSIARQAGAAVTGVHIDTPTRATVTYDIDVAGQPALRGQRGTAVRVGGTWKVADGPFCQLLGLAGDHPAACATSGGSGR